MAITEAARHDLYLRLETELGPEEATTLMEHLPPVGWADVTTKHDLDMQSALLRSDFGALRSDFEAHRVATKQNIDTQSALLRADLQSHRGETKQEFSVLRTEIQNSELRLMAAMGEKINRLLFQILALVGGLVTALLIITLKG